MPGRFARELHCLSLRPTTGIADLRSRFVGGKLEKFVRVIAVPYRFVPRGRTAGMDDALDPETVATIDRFWAERLGCMPGNLREGGLTFTSLPENGLGGIAIFDREESRVVAAPGSKIERLRDEGEALGSDPENLDLQDLPVPPSAKLLGPQVIAYADVDTFRPVHDANTRTLNRPAAEGVQRLRADCGQEWETRADDISFESHDTLVGRFIGNDIMAVAAYRAESELVARISTITHPKHRNRGFGTGAASAAVTEALADDYVAECRPLEAWETAVDIGEFLGFQRYGTAWRIAYR